MQFDRILARRVVGVATLAYGASLAIRPATLTSPARLPETPGYEWFARAIGVRDVLSGASLVATAADPERARWAVTARVLADASDVVVFGVLCPPSAKAKAMAIAAGYGLTCALTHPAR